MDKAVAKIWEQIAETGVVTNNQLSVLAIYERKKQPPKPNTIDQVFKYGNQAIILIDKVFPSK